MFSCLLEGYKYWAAVPLGGLWRHVGHAALVSSEQIATQGEQTDSEDGGGRIHMMDVLQVKVINK